MGIIADVSSMQKGVCQQIFFWLPAARVRVPGGLPFSQLQQREKDHSTFLKSNKNIHFFFLHCRASTGHGRSTLEECESKKGEPEITCRRLSTGLESRTKPKTKKPTQTKQKQKASETGENPRKKGETIRAPKPLISSLPPCSVSALPSIAMWVIRCPSCPLPHHPAQAGLSHQARVVAV